MLGWARRTARMEASCAPVPASLRVFLLVSVLCASRVAVTFNLDSEKPSVFSGPQGSYFGFSVDVFMPDPTQLRVLIGAPKANMSGSSVLQRGAVYSCPWQSTSGCQELDFSSTGDQTMNGVHEYKSNQWFGASVRSQGEHILACAPLYQWSTFAGTEREPVGTCFLKKADKVVEYSPCRTTMSRPEGQGFCQAGFSADFLKGERVVVGGPGSFYWQGQLISDEISEIMKKYRNDFVPPKYEKQLFTNPADPQYDDSYLGYSVTVADFDGDGADDFVTGVPRGDSALGYVNILNGKNMVSMANFTGVQMAAYFGHSVAVTDTNRDGLVDLLVGAPLFMERGSDGKLREVGQVYVYLGRGGFAFHPPRRLTGSEIYGRFGSSVAPLGDLDMDGFNDVAIAAPYGSPDHQGLVYIHNGRTGGLDSMASQVLRGRWAGNGMPAAFGYALHGAADIDRNGYPDLVVGVFGADKAVLYRSRPVISVNATLDVIPAMLNPDQKSCTLPGSTEAVSCFKVKLCLQATGKGAPASLQFHVDVTLDRLKHKGAPKRVLFLNSRLSNISKNVTVGNGKGAACEELDAYLNDESQFRDKITPIAVLMEYSLNYEMAADKTGLLPILDQSAPANVTKQAHILLDCGEDNICKPNLKLSVVSEQKELYIGDDNPLTLEVTAENAGEGAYEAELHVSIPPQADFSEVIRSETLSKISCAYKEPTLVACDLGNPMKGGTKITAGLRFSVHKLSDEDTTVKFDLQIVSSNQFDNTSQVVTTTVKLAVLAKVEIRGVSAPEEIVLPIANWQPTDPPTLEDHIGPSVQHIYELRNNGPSAFSEAVLDVEWPYTFENGSLLYIIKLEVDGPMNCRTDVEINPLNITSPEAPSSNATRDGDNRSDDAKRRHVHRRDLEDKQPEDAVQTLDCVKAQCLKIKCQVGRLERSKNAVLTIYSRLFVATFLKANIQNQTYALKSTGSFRVIQMPYKNLQSELSANSTALRTMVTWAVSSIKQPVPAWVIALAVLAGLLLLALMILVMYKFGFFKRVRPPQDDTVEKEQLQPQDNAHRYQEPAAHQ
uniref:Integrin, alpha V n=1 Tax=Scleropages formosus TaxID=113540 RepID=A0A8C9WER6_SCLFO